MGEIGSKGGSRDCPTHLPGNHPGSSAEKSNREGSPPSARKTDQTLVGREHLYRSIRYLDGDVHIILLRNTGTDRVMNLNIRKVHWYLIWRLLRIRGSTQNRNRAGERNSTPTPVEAVQMGNTPPGSLLVAIPMQVSICGGVSVAQ